MKEWKNPQVKELPSNSLDGEVLPSSYLNHGDIRPINDEIAYHERVAAQKDVHRYHVEVYDLGPLHNAHHEGFDYVMRLPRVNVAACIAKYGVHYDALVRYMEFVKALATRNGIIEFKVIGGPLYVFRSKADAEKLRQKLIEQQEKTELEFETIEGSQPPPIADQTDTNR